ncbi:hypothetical protein [Erythrobacter sp. Alg231-14]|uniref:hypothetical protein n=1 Tax=Erythrobacter sp. Alg231-14 TaxID=1922225 RepID=UPI00307B3755
MIRRRRMRWLATLAATAIVPGVALIATPLAAQSVEHTPDTYDNLVEVLRSEVDQTAATDRALEIMRGEYAVHPTISSFESQSPGFIDDIIDALRPLIRAHDERGNAILEGEMAALFRAELTPEEADEIAVLYSTPVINRLMQNVSRNFDPENVMGALLSDAPVSETDVRADSNTASSQAYYQLSQEERATVDSMLSNTAAWPKFVVLLPEVNAIQTRVQNIPPNDEQTAAMKAIVQDVFKEHFAN